MYAIGVDILTKKGDFTDTIVDKGLNFSQDITWSTVFFFSTEARYYAECTGVVAPH